LLKKETAQAEVPVKLQVLVELSSFGIDPANLKLQTVSLQSDKYVCVREPIPGDSIQSSLIIVDLEKGGQPRKTGVKGDAAMMSPTGKLLAVKAPLDGGQQRIQVIDLQERKIVKEAQMGQIVIYWKWISNNTLGLVTATSVFHWNMDDNNPPVRVFDRIQELADHQIINYQVNSSGQWMVLVGIAQRGTQVVGNMQLYSMERNVSQAIPGHAAALIDMTFPGLTTGPTTVICFATRTEAGGKFFIFEVGKKDTPLKKATDIFFPPNDGDFPTAIVLSPKTYVAYMVTKFGILYVFDLLTLGRLICMTKISSHVCFVATPHEATDGILCINTKGQVLSASLNGATVISYVTNQLGDFELARSLVGRPGFVGGDDLFKKQFETLFRTQQYEAAVKLAAESPGGVLRTKQTIQLLQSLPSVPGKQPYIMQYFLLLLERGKLNKHESVELARPVLQQNRKDLIEKWLQEDKFECSEELGDLCRPYDLKLALSVYYRAKCKEKVIALLAETGQYAVLIKYALQEKYQPDWMGLLSVICGVNPSGAAEFAELLILNESGPLVDKNAVVDLFVARNLIPETTKILLNVLNGDKSEDGPLQTRLLEINLSYAPHVADHILGQEIFTHFNKKRIAELCEQKGLYMRALELYEDIRDIRRVVQQHADAVENPKFWLQFFSRWSKEDSYALLKDMLKNNHRKNLLNVVAVAQHYSGPDQLKPDMMIKLFEEFNSNEGKFLYLQAVVNVTDDPEVVFKYIESAAKSGQVKEVERVVREKNYDPVRVRDFLMEARLPDQGPLIELCNRFGFVDALTNFFYRNGMKQQIEVYVHNYPQNTPQVVGALLDNEANEDFIKNLLNIVGPRCSVEQLVEEVEKRNKLKLLLQWLEARVNEGNKETATYNALAKIYIDTKRDVENFLLTNQFYDSRVVGKYCESRNPNLAVVAYRRGFCHDELIAVTNAHELFKQQAKYLVEQKDPQLWAKVLNPDNTYRPKVVDQVVHSILPETKDASQVKVTVKAFIDANLEGELLELLEKLVLHTSEFSQNPKLQNLLILTAIRCNRPRVMEFLQRLDKYDHHEIAEIALKSGLYPEAFFVYKKIGENLKAIQVLLHSMKDLDKAAEFAEKVKQPEVYTELAKAQLENGKVKESIESYIKAQEPNSFLNVIEAAKKQNLYDDLVKYLQMARKKIREWKIETELVYALAKSNRLSELEDFISGTHYARLQDVGDRCFDEELYEAARIIYSKIPNYSRLATTLIRLKQYVAAVEAARKDNNISTWKQVCKACVEAKEFKLAHQCGQHVIVQADELEDIIKFYEKRGHFTELIDMLEEGLHADSASNVHTELAILYSKYAPNKLMKHISNFHDKITIPKVAAVCEKNQQWSELAFLHVKYSEFDKAANVMMQHSVDAWDHLLFKDVIVKVANPELHYKAIEFYVQEQPTLVTELLAALSASGQIDHARVVNVVRKLGQLPLIKKYLIQVQEHNIPEVNEALNELYIEEEDYEALKMSIDKYDKFDSLALAKKLEKHELLEFRRIAAYLYRKNEEWAKSIQLSKTDKMDEDAIKTAAASKDVTVAEELLTYFAQQKNAAAFVACLYACYDLVRPDVVLELAWLHKMTDYAMPFLIQVLREYTTKVDKLTHMLLSKEGTEAQVVPTVAVPPPNVLLTNPLAAPVVPLPVGAPPTLPPGVFVSPTASAATSSGVVAAAPAAVPIAVPISTVGVAPVAPVAPPSPPPPTGTIAGMAAIPFPSLAGSTPPPPPFV
jgi:clathrin heavy chain